MKNKLVWLSILAVEISIFMGTYSQWYDFIQLNLMFWGGGYLFIRAIRFIIYSTY
jgi:hypothetical protein